MLYLSVCSGIEAATVAWHPLGWRPWAFAEIDTFPSAVLAHHYPNVPNFGDMTRFQEWPDAALDVLVGGTPCQSFSVAGLRKGLDDPRGNLMLTYGAIACRYQPQWLVWENVPGVLSSNGGRDFGSFLGLLGELGYGFAYRVLDAQYFGLAQRRKRVFVVACLGDWRRAAAVLFERSSLRGDSAPRREAREGAAGTLARGARSRGGYSEDDIPHVACPPVSAALKARDYKGPSSDGDGDGDGAPLVPVVAPTLRAGGNRTGGNRPPGTDVDTCETLVPVHAFDARQSDVIQYGDRTGPLDTDGHTMAVAFDWQMGAKAGGIGAAVEQAGTLNTARVQAVVFDTTQVTHPENRSNPQPGDPCHPLAAGAHPPTVIAYSLRNDAGRAGEAKTPSADADGRVRLRDPGFNVCEEHAPTLDSGRPHTVAFAQNQLGEVRVGDTVGTLNTNSNASGRNTPMVSTAMQVRRLTPRECERLQGFPDDYTLIPYRGKPAADGPRYKALGNSMAVPVMRWIGQRIAMVDEVTRARI